MPISQSGRDRPREEAPLLPAGGWQAQHLSPSIESLPACQALLCLRIRFDFAGGEVLETMSAGNQCELALPSGEGNDLVHPSLMGQQDVTAPHPCGGQRCLPHVWAASMTAATAVKPQGIAYQHLNFSPALTNTTLGRYSHHGLRVLIHSPVADPTPSRLTHPRRANWTWSHDGRPLRRHPGF